MNVAIGNELRLLIQEAKDEKKTRRINESTPVTQNTS